ncbi:hypothetical protein [Kaistia nematophila]|uniref:Uncharacterized protein n=1 Tax=Kaistia nematophila TaxID=2994654 RepID=A0A9X3E324_9HYPH|nr:hypothetical protein [Kaistia nematophila]MCX5570584.1 hypothetical protein [Kaistia nematophila]
MNEPKAKDRPMLFSGPMVRALLDGRKTQTRRRLDAWTDEPLAYVEAGAIEALDADDRPYRWPRTHAVGDRLWVREAWKAHSTFEGVPPRDVPPSGVFYLADDSYSPSGSRGRPSVFMPRWASRLTLTVTDVRVERLQDISKPDAIAEGLIQLRTTRRWVASKGDQYLGYAHADPRVVYGWLWNTINGDGAWEANPRVAAYTFTIADRNIEAETA